MGVAVDSSGKFLYVANTDSNSISLFSINSASGALVPHSGSPFGGGTYPISIAFDPFGQFVYVANYLGESISAYTFNPTTGALSPIEELQGRGWEGMIAVTSP